MQKSPELTTPYNDFYICKLQKSVKKLQEESEMKKNEIEKLKMKNQLILYLFSEK